MYGSNLQVQALAAAPVLLSTSQVDVTSSQAPPARPRDPRSDAGAATAATAATLAGQADLASSSPPPPSLPALTLPPAVPSSLPLSALGPSLDLSDGTSQLAAPIEQFVFLATALTNEEQVRPPSTRHAGVAMSFR